VSMDDRRSMMRLRILLTSIAVLTFCCSSALWAYTLAFDDIPIGANLGYYSDQYGVFFSSWTSVDSATLGWGQSHSGANVAMWSGSPGTGAFAWFGHRENGEPVYKSVSSLGAYFSTDTDAVIRMVGYSTAGGWKSVASATIGGSGQSWSNRYLEISSQAGDIEWVIFEGVSSPDARYHFYLDDMTVVPVPEPSSILPLAAGLLWLVPIRRRRV
jgi:hypothetical protein